MQTNNRLFDDLAKMAGGAVSALSGVKDELDGVVRRQLEKMLEGMDLVRREEFDAARDMAARAREEQEALLVRLAALEVRLAAAEAKLAGAEPQP